MTRAFKNEAKHAVAVYSDLLIGRGVISEIESENIAGIQHYFFTFNEQLDYPFPVECYGVEELAVVLRAMWLSYDKAYMDLGLL